MACEEDSHSTGLALGHHREPPSPEARVPAAASQSSASVAEPPSTPAGPLVAEDPGFRLLLEENAFQALAQEPLLKRPRTVEDVLSVAGSNLLCLPFPKKLWRLINSSRFTYIWWEKDGTSICLNEKLFQKILERDWPDKVFETDCTKSFIRQLNLYGFSKLCQDVNTSFCLTNCFTGSVEPGPVRVLNKLQFYSSPLFRKDCPHLLKKRRVGVKAAQRQEEDKTEGLGSPEEAEPGSGPPEELLSPVEHQREQQREQQQVLVSGQEHRRPTAQDRSKSAPPVPVKSESAPPAILGASTKHPPTHRSAKYQP